MQPNKIVSRLSACPEVASGHDLSSYLREQTVATDMLKGLQRREAVGAEGGAALVQELETLYARRSGEMSVMHSGAAR